MKSYTITVNGRTYDVTVEEKHANASTMVTSTQSVSQVPTAPVVTPVLTPSVATSSVARVNIEAKAAGKVFKIEAKPGTAVKVGDTILILEVMKMETPVVAPEDGTVGTIEVAVGDAVESGVILATLN